MRNRDVKWKWTSNMNNKSSHESEHEKGTRKYEIGTKNQTQHFNHRRRLSHSRTPSLLIGEHPETTHSWPPLRSQQITLFVRAQAYANIGSSITQLSEIFILQHSSGCSRVSYAKIVSRHDILKNTAGRVTGRLTAVRAMGTARPESNLVLPM